MDGKELTVKEIIATALVTCGYDGLYNPDDLDGCRCAVCNLAPCGNINPGCRPGYYGPLKVITPCGTIRIVEFNDGDGSAFGIGPTRNKK